MIGVSSHNKYMCADDLVIINQGPMPLRDYVLYMAQGLRLHIIMIRMYLGMCRRNDGIP